MEFCFQARLAVRRKRPQILSAGGGNQEEVSVIATIHNWEPCVALICVEANGLLPRASMGQLARVWLELKSQRGVSRE